MEKSRKKEKQKENNLIQALTIVGSEELPVWLIKERKTLSVPINLRLLKS